MVPIKQPEILQAKPVNPRTLPQEAYVSPPDLTGTIISDPSDFQRRTSGGYGDIYKCHLRDSQDQLQPVAVKVPKCASVASGDVAVIEKQWKLYRREIKTCKWLDHENIIPLLGTINGPSRGPYPYLVFPWAANGTLTEYLKAKGPDFPLHSRFRIMDDVTSGLSYLHRFGVVHGDLSGSNVLIDEKHTAKLADFGLSDIKMEFKGTSYFTSASNGAVRWTAPELLNPLENCVLEVTTQHDIYSLGRIFLQVITGRIPFSDTRWDARVIYLMKCWSPYGERPEVNAALETVRQFYSEAKADAVGKSSIAEEEDDGIAHTQDSNSIDYCFETVPNFTSDPNRDAVLFGSIDPGCFNVRFGLPFWTRFRSRFGVRSEFWKSKMADKVLEEPVKLPRRFGRLDPRRSF